jgi:catechol 2,3-dioxygenase-like lactoylglutathione lyase family enzyme
LLPVKNLEGSQRFYESLFDAPGRPVGGGRVYFDCGPVLFGLLDPSAENANDVHPLPEPVYFATPDLERTYRRALALGCLSTERIHGGDSAGKISVRPWGERSFYVFDPSGNPLCFVDERTLFTGTPRQVRALERRFAPKTPPEPRPRKTPPVLRRSKRARR